MVRPCQLPRDALLRKYLDAGDYTDCYSLELDSMVSQPQFIRAFYTTRVFKLERLILKYLLKKSSTDADAARLAEAGTDSFAAWRVEQRSENQLLLCDFSGNTRSWLMTLPLRERDRCGTRLFFGSAIIAQTKKAGGKATLAPTFRLLLGFHRLYSRILLRAAASRLQRRQA